MKAPKACDNLLEVILNVKFGTAKSVRKYPKAQAETAPLKTKHLKYSGFLGLWERTNRPVRRKRKEVSPVKTIYNDIMTSHPFVNLLLLLVNYPNASNNLLFP